MNVIAAVAKSIVAILRIIAFGWIEDARDILRKLAQVFHRWQARRQLPERARRASPDPCVPLREPAFHRPDPLIYSQYELMRNGFAVTWDNPDIVVHRAGTPVSGTDLEPATDYEIVARIWNNSTDAPVVGLPIRFSFLSFGVGVQSHPIGGTAVDLGVKGAPDHPAFVRMKWRTPAEPGHYCVQVLLDPVDDLNFGNNLGQDNVVVGHPHSPVEFAFQLRNQAPREQQFRFEFDAYHVSAPPRCEERPPQPPADDRGAPARQVTVDGRPVVPVPPAHDRANHPLPSGWLVDVEPSEPHLAPGEQTTIRTRVTAPDGFTGRQPVNVNVFDALGFVGGVTLYIEAP